MSYLSELPTDVISLIIQQLYTYSDLINLYNILSNKSFENCWELKIRSEFKDLFILINNNYSTNNSISRNNINNINYKILNIILYNDNIYKRILFYSKMLIVYNRIVYSFYITSTSFKLPIKNDMFFLLNLSEIDLKHLKTITMYRKITITSFLVTYKRNNKILTTRTIGPHDKITNKDFLYNIDFNSNSLNRSQLVLKTLRSTVRKNYCFNINLKTEDILNVYLEILIYLNKD